MIISTLFALPVDEQLTGHISRRRKGELEIVVVDHPAVKAAIALQGAHLLSWRPAGEEEVLWLSNDSAFTSGVAVRGGVPVCWPWFGPASDSALPAHGFARILPWHFKAHNEDENGLVLTLELQQSEETRRYWPHDFTLYARFKLGKTCEIELEAHGEFESTAALHGYFHVGDSGQVQVSGLGEQFIDKVNDGEHGALPGGIQTFPDRTDRVFLTPDACSHIIDPKLHRCIDVVHHHHANVVAWNPGPALSQSMKDMPDDGYKTFVCVETACVTRPQITAEEKPSRLGQTLRIMKKSAPL